jgi:phosphoribosylglycinamide formyltransferase-1
MTARLVVLASGDGTNLQAVIDACASGVLPADVVAVVSNNPDSGALRRATAAGIPGVHVGRLSSGAESRREYDARLADVVSGFDPQWIICAGWMLILSMNFLGWFPRMVVNVHPALPGELPGTDSIRRAYSEFKQGVRTGTGVMVHFIVDEGVDDGPTLGVADIPLDSDDTLDTLTERFHDAEHRLLVDTLVTLCTTGASA